MNGLVIAGKYHIVQLIAHGGMGAVYDAIHAKTGRRVALKLMNERALASGPVSLRRFERESRAAGAVDSLHVVQVLDAGEDETSGMPFIVMEHLEGEDLRNVLARSGPLPSEEAIAIAKQVCLGLVKAHAADIIHRDLKPANLFLVKADDGRQLVKILDFGVAKLLDETESGRVTKTGDVVGSPSYMSPEQLLSPRTVDHRSDLWSLGVVLYEMLSGGVPTAHIDAIGGRVHAICHVPATSLAGRVPGIRPELVALVQRALAIAPDARFSSAAEMLAALRMVQPDDIELRGVGVVARRAPAEKRVTPLELETTERAPVLPRWRASMRARWLAPIAVACVAALGIHLGRSAASSDPEPDPKTEEQRGAPEEPQAASAPPPAADEPTSATSPRSGTIGEPKPSLRTPAVGARKLTGRSRTKASEGATTPRSVPTTAPGRDQL